MIFGLFLVVFAAALTGAAIWFALGLIHDHDPGDMPLFRQSALPRIAVEIPYTHMEWLPRSYPEVHHPRTVPGPAARYAGTDQPASDERRAGDPASTSWSKGDARDLAARLDFDRLLRHVRPVQ